MYKDEPGNGVNELSIVVLRVFIRVAWAICMVSELLSIMIMAYIITVILRGSCLCNMHILFRSTCTLCEL